MKTVQQISPESPNTFCERGTMPFVIHFVHQRLTYNGSAWFYNISQTSGIPTRITSIFSFFLAFHANLQGFQLPCLQRVSQYCTLISAKFCSLGGKTEKGKTKTIHSKIRLLEWNGCFHCCFWFVFSRGGSHFWRLNTESSANNFGT